jgi:hypothetical protein
MCALRAAKAWITRYGVESMIFFLGDADKHINMLREFGLSKKDCPVVMVHHVHRENKRMYINEQEGEQACRVDSAHDFEVYFEGAEGQGEEDLPHDV